MEQQNVPMFTFDDYSTTPRKDMVLNVLLMRNKDVSKILGPRFTIIKRIHRESRAVISFQAATDFMVDGSMSYVLLDGTPQQNQVAKDAIQAEVLRSYGVDVTNHPVVFMSATDVHVAKTNTSLFPTLSGIQSFEAVTRTWVKVQRIGNHSCTVSLIGDQTHELELLYEHNSGLLDAGELYPAYEPDPTWDTLFGQSNAQLTSSPTKAPKNRFAGNLLDMAFDSMIIISIGCIAAISRFHKKYPEHSEVAAFVTMVGYISLIWATLLEKGTIFKILLSLGVAAEVFLVVVACIMFFSLKAAIWCGICLAVVAFSCVLCKTHKIKEY